MALQTQVSSVNEGNLSKIKVLKELEISFGNNPKTPSAESETMAKLAYEIYQPRAPC